LCFCSLFFLLSEILLSLLFFLLPFVIELLPFFESLFDLECEKGLRTLREHLYLLDRYSIHYFLVHGRERIKVDLFVDEAKLALFQFILEAGLEMRRVLFYPQTFAIDTLLGTLSFKLSEDQQNVFEKLFAENLDVKLDSILDLLVEARTLIVDHDQESVNTTQGAKTVDDHLNVCFVSTLRIASTRRVHKYSLICDIFFQTKSDSFKFISLRLSITRSFKPFLATE
jgi:hypothetical protein